MKIWQDLRYGARMLVKQPGFTLIAVLTLALGSGATTAIFSVVNAVLLRPLPYPAAEKLLWVGQQFGGTLAAAGEPKFLFWREHNQSFESMAIFNSFNAGGNLAQGQEAEFVAGLKVSADFFRVFGVSPALGRAFTAAEDAPGGDNVVILSDGLWRRLFNAEAAVIGKTILLNGESLIVSGVMPPDFRFAPQPDILRPMRPSLQGDPNPNAMVVGKLKDGATVEQARAELKLLAEKYRAAFPQAMRPNESIGARPYQELFTAGVKQTLWVLLGAVSLLLLIACANVANLQLTRAAARRKEIAVRLALGAGGGRIVRQLLTEGLLLALAGGALGLLLAVWGTEALTAALPERLFSQRPQISFDWRVLLFTLAAALATGLLFGLAPAWQAARVDVNTALKDSAGRSGGATRGRLRGGLVVVEVALSLILLIGATLLMRTFANLRGVDPGFDPRNVLTLRVALNGAKYDTAAEAAAFYREALARLKAVPGVAAAAHVNTLPLAGQFNLSAVFPERPDNVMPVQFRMITPEYFAVLKIALRQGRAFTDADNAAGPPVAIVNETFARQFPNSQNPFAQQLSIGRNLGDPPWQVVGIVADQKQFSLLDAPPPMVYLLFEQVSDKLMQSARRFVAGYLTVRTTVEPLSLSRTLSRELAAVDATLPVSQVRSLEQVVGSSIAPQRFNLLLFGLFAVLGVLLAALGIYGVLSYTVAQRTNEIGIRLALGAQRRTVLRLILRRGLALALAGVALGLLAALGLTRLLAKLLYGVSATDPATFVLVALLVLLVALLACWIPARRATKVDPLIALRAESDS